jgi:DNA-binding response OmpR family regulator
MKILTAEDNEMLRTVLTGNLVAWGHELVVCTDAARPGRPSRRLMLPVSRFLTG